MSVFDPLTTTLLDLAHALRNEESPLVVGGGFGLYLKQQYLQQTGARLLLTELPLPRATNDIDLFLRVDVLAKLASMKSFAHHLDALGFQAVDEARYMQWLRKFALNGVLHEVKIDLLVGPLGAFEAQLKTDGLPRVRPKGELKLHAHLTDEALEIDLDPLAIPLQGRLTDGSPFLAKIYVPSAFPYLMMKLFAFDDRKHDDQKGLGSHHAMDLYRIVAMMTEPEYKKSLDLAKTYRSDHRFLRGCQIVTVEFAHETSLGILRLQEHELSRGNLQLADFRSLLVEVFSNS